MLAAIMLLSGLFGACAPTPSADELAAVRGGKDALVLIRLACGDPQHEYPDFLYPASSLHRLDLQISHALSLGYLEADGRPRRIYAPGTYRVVSKAAWSQGWFAVIWAPGYHYLTFGMRGGPVTEFGTAFEIYPSVLPAEAPLWRIEVPAGAPVIYAGTFRSAACSGDKGSPETLQHQFGQDPTLRLEDEREGAAAVISRDLPTLPPPVTRLAVLQTGPLVHGLPPSDRQQ